jgi:hypothetical protein
MQKSRGGHAWRRLMRMAIGALGAVALTLLSAIPAGATTPLPNSAGAYWASLPLVGENANLVSAGATFVVPTLNCAGNTKTLGESFGVEQGASEAFIGYEQSIVRAECKGTTPSYHFIVKVGTTSFTENGVSPGDTVVASFYQTSTFAQSTVHDLTSGFTWLAQGSALSLGAADIGEFDVVPSAVPLHVAPFGSVTFTNCQVNDDYLGFGNNLTAWNLQLETVTNITTGAITGGNHFKLTFHHS